MEKGEVLIISQVKPVYTLISHIYYGLDIAKVHMQDTHLELSFTEMPKTKFKPGMKIRVIVEE